MARSTALHLGLLLALAGLLCFAGLGRTHLTDRDEGANAGAAREMFDGGSWLSPTLNGAPRFAKPAFTYWLMAAAYAVTGVSELGARLPSAVAVAALVVVQYGFARWALGPEAALRAALVLLLGVEVVALGRMALTDALLTLWTTVAGLTAFRAHEGDPPRTPWYAVTWTALALATLTKGPVGLAVPLLGLAAYHVVRGQWRRALGESRPVWGLSLFLLLAAPWYAAMFWLHGADYAARARGETLGRVFRTVVGPGGTVLFYLPVLLIGLFPWSALLPGALVTVLRGARTRARSGRPGALAVLAATWLVAGLVLFSLVQTRLPHYVLPLLPFAALLLAATWPVAVPRLARALLVATGTALAGGAALAVLAGDRVTRLLDRAYPAAPEARLPASILVVAVLAALLGATAILRDGHRLFPTLAALVTAMLLVGVHVALPAFDATFVAAGPELARTMGRVARPCDDLVALGPYRPSFVFYAGRPLAFIGRREPERLAALAEQPGRRLMVLAPAAMGPELPPALRSLPVMGASGGYTLRASPRRDEPCP